MIANADIDVVYPGSTKRYGMAFAVGIVRSVAYAVFDSGVRVHRAKHMTGSLIIDNSDGRGVFV